MKKTLVAIILIVMICFTSTSEAGTPATLKDQTIKYSAGSYLAGQSIPLGVDPYGYNYQARSFNGSYFNSYANSAGLPPYNGDSTAYLAANSSAVSHWAWPYRDVQLAMKWNDAWLSNQDKDGDGKLDRPASYKGSGAWLSNHMSGEYDQDGKTQNWNYFTKIVAVPNDAIQEAGKWMSAAGTEIGPVNWGDFATVQEVSNDTGTDDHGVLYRSPSGAGVGQY